MLGGEKDCGRGMERTEKGDGEFWKTYARKQRKIARLTIMTASPATPFNLSA